MLCHSCASPLKPLTPACHSIVAIEPNRLIIVVGQLAHRVQGGTNGTGPREGGVNKGRRLRRRSPWSRVLPSRPLLLLLLLLLGVDVCQVGGGHPLSLQVLLYSLLGAVDL